MFNISDKESEYSVYRQSKAQLEGKLSELDSEYTSTNAGASTLSAQSNKSSSEIDTISEENDKPLK